MKKPSRYLAEMRLYRRRIAQLALDDEQRHDLNARLTGKLSSTKFNAADWRLVLDHLNDLVGEPTPAKFRRRPSSHVSRFTPHAFPLDGCCTPEQEAYLRDLAKRVPWQSPDPASALRTLIARRAWSKRQQAEADQWLRGNGSLASLPRQVAARAIRILKRMAASASVQLVEDGC